MSDTKKIKYALIKRLKADSGVSSLVGSRITPRRLAVQSAYPALIVHKISENKTFEHSGDISVIQTRIQIDCIGSKDADVESMKDAVITNLHLYQGIVDGCDVHLCYLDNEGDLFEDEFFEEDEYIGNLDFIIIWRKL